MRRCAMGAAVAETNHNDNISMDSEISQAVTAQLRAAAPPQLKGNANWNFPRDRPSLNRIKSGCPPTLIVPERIDSGNLLPAAP
jgi:hypothetical protein